MPTKIQDLFRIVQTMKFGRILQYLTKDIKSAANCQIIEPLTEKKKTRG